MSEQLIKTPGTFGDNDNFLLERELGAGGMGGVYMGRDKMLDRPVAVKVMLPEYGSDPEFVDKFKKEAQSAARLLHPNIAQVYSYGICQGMPYIAMELASGGSLYSLMQANPGKIDIQRALKICQQTAQALQCATDQGVVHGDVKPENILLDANGNAKLVDFGLAAMQKDTNEIWGTPYYISPEKVKKEVIDFRADMYSLGGTLYHALTGVSPFEGDDAIAVVKKRFQGAPAKPSTIRAEITPAVDNLVMKMLELDRENRYPSFEALLEAFKEVLTTGLTQKIQRPDVASTKAAPATGTKRMMTTRRRPMMKKPGTTGPISGTTQAVDPSAAPTEEMKGAPETAPEEEEGANIAKKMIIGIVGGIVALAAIAGGIVWYLQSEEQARLEKARLAQVEHCRNARSAIEKIVANTKSIDESSQADLDNSTKACNKLADELAKILPEHAASFKQGGAAPQVPEDSPLANTLASVHESMSGIWDRLQKGQEARAKISAAAAEILASAAKADEITGDDTESGNALAKLGNELNAKLEEMKLFDKDQKGNSIIRGAKKWVDQTGSQISNKAVREIKIMKGEAERAQKKIDAEKAEAAKREAEAKRKAELQVKEVAEISAKFDSIVAQGCFRQLDWESGYRQLKQLSDIYETLEGQREARFQARKIDLMKGVQEHFVKSAKGHVFKNGKALKGSTLVAFTTDERTKAQKIAIKPKKGSQIEMTWQKFYTEQMGGFDDLIVTYIQKNDRLPRNTRKDLLAGTALTLRIVCSANASAGVKAVKLAKMAAASSSEALEEMKKIFPDIDFSDVKVED